MTKPEKKHFSIFQLIASVFMTHNSSYKHTVPVLAGHHQKAKTKSMPYYLALQGPHLQHSNHTHIVTSSSSSSDYQRTCCS